MPENTQPLSLLSLDPSGVELASSSASARRISSILSMHSSSGFQQDHFTPLSNRITSSGDPADFSCFISSLSASTLRSFCWSDFVSIADSAERSFISRDFLRSSGEEPSFSLADLIRLS